MGLLSLINTIFTVYGAMIAIRIVGSWFPKVAVHPVMRFVGSYTDPYLNIYRRFIPPLGGTLDLTPMLAYFGLQAIQYAIRFLVLNVLR
jgi:YggT family protein